MRRSDKPSDESQTPLLGSRNTQELPSQSYGAHDERSEIQALNITLQSKSLAISHETLTEDQAKILNLFLKDAGESISQKMLNAILIAVKDKAMTEADFSEFKRKYLDLSLEAKKTVWFLLTDEIVHTLKQSRFFDVRDSDNGGQQPSVLLACHELQTLTDSQIKYLRACYDIKIKNINALTPLEFILRNGVGIMIIRDNILDAPEPFPAPEKLFYFILHKILTMTDKLKFDHISKMVEKLDFKACYEAIAQNNLCSEAMRIRALTLANLSPITIEKIISNANDSRTLDKASTCFSFEVLGYETTLDQLTQLKQLIYERMAVLASQNISKTIGDFLSNASAKNPHQSFFSNQSQKISPLLVASSHLRISLLGKNLLESILLVFEELKKCGDKTPWRDCLESCVTQFNNLSFKVIHAAIIQHALSDNSLSAAEKDAIKKPIINVLNPLEDLALRINDGSATKQIIRQLELIKGNAVGQAVSRQVGKKA